MRKLVIGIYMLLPLIVLGQEKGVVFVNATNWKQVLEKARLDRKYIFVDVYATWCGPCKKMDSDVYTDDKVSQYLNANFISLKVQIDKTKNDNDTVKIWYADAKFLTEKYNIEALPCLLFFSPGGDLVQRAEGYRDAQNFLSLVQLASNPNDNYAGLIKRYKSGELKGDDLLTFALEAKKYQDDSLSMLAAKQYKNSWLDKQKPSDIVSKRLLDFYTGFYVLVRAKDPLTRFIYRNPVMADSLMEAPGYSVRLTDFVITNDIISPLIKSNGKFIDTRPNWNTIDSYLTKLYDSKTSARLLLNARLAWYTDKKDWATVAKYSIEKIESNGIDTVGMAKAGINNVVFNIIVKHSNDQFVMNKGLQYMRLILKNNFRRPDWIDTYASLLYKMGKKEEAIKLQYDAISLAEEKGDTENLKEFKETLEKMQKNLPLW